MSKPLTSLEMAHAATLLDMAGDEFGNHGCTDYPVPNTPENYAMLVAMDIANGDPEETPEYDPDADELWLSDWCVMVYLADRMREATDDA